MFWTFQKFWESHSPVIKIQLTAVLGLNRLSVWLESNFCFDTMTRRRVMMFNYTSRGGIDVIAQIRRSATYFKHTLPRVCGDSATASGRWTVYCYKSMQCISQCLLVVWNIVGVSSAATMCRPVFGPGSFSDTSSKASLAQYEAFVRLRFLTNTRGRIVFWVFA